MDNIEKQKRGIRASDLGIDCSIKINRGYDGIIGLMFLFFIITFGGMWVYLSMVL